MADDGGNESIYQTRHKRSNTKQKELLQTVSTALISKNIINASLSLLLEAKVKTIKSASDLEATWRLYSQPITPVLYRLAPA